MRTLGFGLVLVFASVLASPTALAEPDKKGPPAATKGDKDKGDKDKGDKDKGDKGDSHPAAAAKSDDDDDDGPATDGGKPVAGRRTPAQLTFRKETWARREKAIDGAVHRAGKKMSDEQKELIQKHWLTMSRLIRIRELAQEDKDDAVVKRVDAALAKAEKSCDAKLEKLAGGAK